MTEDPKISIIVPVYKVEKYLRQCLDSILVQTFEDWECILVDDGSPDNSGRICDEYAQKDLRFRVIHKENGGVSSARNVGIDNAAGDFLMFVDSDDCIEHNYLNDLISCPESDIVVSGFKRIGFYTDIVEYSNQRILLRDELKNIWSQSAVNFPYWYPWCKLFKASIIKRCNLKFDESLFYGEDFCFVIDYLYHSKTLYVLKNHGYIHLHEQYRYDKYKMNVDQLYAHYHTNDEKLKNLEAKYFCKFNIIRGHLYMRLLNNYFASLRQCNSLQLFLEEFCKSNRFISNMYTKETMMYFSLKKRIVMLYFSKLPILLFFFRKKIY